LVLLRSNAHGEAVFFQMDDVHNTSFHFLRVNQVALFDGSVIHNSFFYTEGLGKSNQIAIFFLPLPESPGKHLYEILQLYSLFSIILDFRKLYVLRMTVYLRIRSALSPC